MYAYRISVKHKVNETVVSYTVTNQTFVITSYITAVVYRPNKDTDMYTQALMIRKSGTRITNTDTQWDDSVGLLTLSAPSSSRSLLLRCIRNCDAQMLLFVHRERIRKIRRSLCAENDHIRYI